MADLLGSPLPARIMLGVLFAALLISVVTDLRRRLILNVVTLPALLAICACIVWQGGLALLAEAALGLIVCAGPLALATFRRAMGWGDVKLIALPGAVAGAAAGWPFALTILLYVSVAGGVQAIAWIVAAKMRGHERPRYVPYGVSIAAGTIAAFLWGSALF